MNKLEPLILWGGTDIDPKYYGEVPLPTTDEPDVERDMYEFAKANQAIKEGRPLIGICRGAQLLCVANKGKLLQHVPSHRNNNHSITVSCEGVEYTFDTVKADHHQVMIPVGDYIVYGKADDGVPEVVYWPDTKCLAIQPHPEWMPSDHPFNVWLNNLIFSLFGLKGVF